MPVCPKCGFSGQDEDACERCGIIYSRMHTVVDFKPGDLSALRAAAATIRSASERNGVASESPRRMSTGGGQERTIPPRGAEPTAPSPGPSMAPAPAMAPAPPIPAIAQAFPGVQARRPEATAEPRMARTEREVTIVPMVPPPPPKRTGARLAFLLALLLTSAAVWGLMQWRDARMRAAAGADDAPDAEYFDIRLAAIVDDARAELRQVRDPETTTKLRDGLSDRVRFLHDRLEGADVSDARKTALGKVIDDLNNFLATDVGAVIAAALADRAPPAAATDAGIATDGGDLAFEEPSETDPKPAKPAVAVATPPKPRKIDQEPLQHISDALASLPP